MPEFKDHPADPSYRTQIIVYRLSHYFVEKIFVCRVREQGKFIASSLIKIKSLLYRTIRINFLNC